MSSSKEHCVVLLCVALACFCFFEIIIMNDAYAMASAEMMRHIW